MPKKMMRVGDPDPMKVKELVAAMEHAGVKEIGDNGTFHANVGELAAVAKVAHDAGFSVEVLGPGRSDGELHLRISQNVDSAPIDRKTFVSGKISTVMGPRQDVGH